MTKVVTELVIDARGAEAGTAAYSRAMDAAQKAVDRVLDRERQLQDAMEKQTAVMASASGGISTTARAWDRLKASVDPAYQATKAMEKALMTVDQAAIKLGVDQAEVARVTELARQKFDAQAISAAKAAAALDAALERDLSQAVNAELALMDQYEAKATALRGRIDPLATAQDRLNRQMEEYSAMARRGVISTQELAAAHNMAQQEFQQTKDRLDAVNSVTAGQRNNAGFYAANMGYQFQDIAVTSAMGMNPMMIGLQQGMQMSSLFAGQGMTGAVSMLGSAFASLISPVTLVTVGLTAATAAAIQYFMSSEEDAEAASQALQEHESAVGKVVQRWGDAVPSIKAYLAELEKARGADEINQVVQQAVERTYEAPRAALDDIISTIRRANTELNRAVPGGADEIDAYRASWQQLRTALEGNTATADQARQMHALSLRLFEETGIPTLKALADEYKTLADVIGDAADRAEEFRIEADPMSRQEAARQRFFARLRGGVEEVDMNDDLSARFGERQRSDRRAARGGRDTAKQIEEAYQSRLRAMDAAIAAQRLELDLLGKTADEAARLRNEHQWTAQAREDAARRGVAVDSRELEIIKQKAAALGVLAAERARAEIRGGVAFDMSQLGRTAGDQAIASTMRGAGLEFDSAEAGMLRTIQRLTEVRDLTQDIVGSGLRSVRDALVEGSLSWETFGNVAANVLNRISDRLLQAATDEIAAGFLRMLMGSLSGGLFPSANGNVFSGGRMVQFAHGGISLPSDIYYTPQTFAFASGTGMMSEAGPEAIMPLKRGADGKLGVAASGGGARAQSISLAVNVYGAANGDDAEERAYRGAQRAIREYDASLAIKVDRVARKVASDPMAVNTAWD